MSLNKPINLAFFKDLLIQQRENLTQLENEAKQHTETVELDQTKMGRLSRMDALQKQAMSQENQRRRLRELARIHLALKRIDQDDFGFCEECGDNIAPARLNINPTATLCITCAEEQEQQ